MEGADTYPAVLSRQEQSGSEAGGGRGGAAAKDDDVPERAPREAGGGEEELKRELAAEREERKDLEAQVPSPDHVDFHFMLFLFNMFVTPPPPGQCVTPGREINFRKGQVGKIRYYAGGGGEGGSLRF